MPRSPWCEISLVRRERLGNRAPKDVLEHLLSDSNLSEWAVHLDLRTATRRPLICCSAWRYAR